MNKLQQIITDLRKELDDLTFSETIREARDRIGLMQYRTAEHLHMTLGRLKNLETGYFRVMPSASEIRNICEFFELPHDKMIKKAETHIAERRREKKIRTIHGRSTLQ